MTPLSAVVGSQFVGSCCTTLMFAQLFAALRNPSRRPIALASVSAPTMSRTFSGLCSEPNAYRYDARVAQGVVAALRGDAELDRAASIWVIVQRRIVYLQGCVASPQQARRAEAIAAAVPEVERVIPSLSAPGEAPLYPLQSDTAR